MPRQQTVLTSPPQRAEGGQDQIKRRNVNLGDKIRIGKAGPVATVVGLGSSGKAILAWREGCKFYEAAFNDFVRLLREAD